MDIRFLESIIAVVEEGSIASAARFQHLTATAISQRIRTLERQLGVSLLSRSAHSASPTKICLSLLPKFRHLIQESKALLHHADQEALSGKVILGAISTTLLDYIPKIVRVMSDVAPTAHVKIVPGASADLHNKLMRQEIDAAIMVMPPFEVSKKLQLELICEQRLVLIGNHAVFEKGDNVEDILKEHPVILYEKHSWGGQLAWKWLSTYHSEYQLLCELDSVETIAALVKDGLGVAIIPQWQGLEKMRQQLSIVPIQDHQQYYRNIVFISRKDALPQGLIGVIRDVLSAR